MPNRDEPVLFNIGDLVTDEGPKFLGRPKMNGVVIGVFRRLVWVWWEDISQDEVLEPWQLQRRTE